MFESRLIVAVLPHDTYGRDWGTLIDKKMPAVLGSSVAGVIESVSADVTWDVGERVFGISDLDLYSSDQAGLQAYAVLNANAIAKTPQGFSDEEVVTLPINLVTSWAVLFTEKELSIPSPLAQQKTFDHASTSIVIIGGGTNVGQLAVQLARIAGIGRIIVIAGPSNIALLKSMGATHVIDRHSSPADIGRQIEAITVSDGVAQVYNCATLQVEVAVAALSSSEPSRLRLLLPLEDGEAEQLSSQRPLCDFRFMDDVSNESLGSHAEQFWAEVPRWLMDEKILPTKFRVIEGLEKVGEINEALDAYRDLARTSAQTVVKIKG